MIFGRKRRRDEMVEGAAGRTEPYRIEGAAFAVQDEAPAWGSDAGGEGFRFTVQDVFSITGRGTVATGTVSSGRVRVGDTVTLAREGESRPVTVRGIEAFRSRQTEATAGMEVGLLLDGLRRDDLASGDVLTA